MELALGGCSRRYPERHLKIDPGLDVENGFGGILEG